ncbi:MAG: NAD(P)H-hydrate dehydratase, partial [Peptococcaceae bacterium]|nr:NAD(P)H-hydrate dehydratase [Peptococcaceae bacterium]
MYLVTAEQMRQVDRKTIEELGIPEIVLMENAGKAVADFLQEQFDDLSEKTVTILAGAGNNGGDGLVVARYLHMLGVPVKVFLLAERELSPSTQRNYEILSRLPVKLYLLDSENSMHLFKVTVNYSDILVDALLGTGTSREVTGKTEQVIEIINRRSCIKVAIDVPSGLNSDTGELWGKCIKADYTVALAQPKCGHYMNKGLKYCGEVVVKDIGIPQEIYQSLDLNCSIIDQTYLQRCQTVRSRESHKGTYGHLLMLGGSMGMSGAITLAAQAALRSGVGLVSCAVPDSIQMHVAVNIPEAMVHPVQEDSVQHLLPGKSAVVIGPGMGATERTGMMMLEVLQAGSCGVVVDADALNVAEYWLDEVKDSDCQVILTPHPGEMARLTGLSAEYIQQHRLEVAQSFAQEHGVWVVLKGANTVAATPDGRLYMNITDSPSLAVAGSGDVLSGIIGAMLAQGMKPEDACCIAVYLHGRAG